MLTYGVMLLDTSTFVSHITGRAFKKCIGHPYDLQFSQAQTIFHVESETQELLLAWGEEAGGGGSNGLELVPSPCVVGTGTIRSFNLTRRMVDPFDT
jgi:hypothetical protein